jgi:hypothetical protein
MPAPADEEATRGRPSARRPSARHPERRAPRAPPLLRAKAERVHRVVDEDLRGRTREPQVLERRPGMLRVCGRELVVRESA